MQSELPNKTLGDRDQFIDEVERLKEAIAAAVEDQISAAKRAIKRDRRTAEDLVDDIKEGKASQAGALRAPVSIRAQRQIPVN